MAFLVGYFMSSVKWSMIAYAAGYLIILLVRILLRGTIFRAAQGCSPMYH